MNTLYHHTPALLPANTGSRYLPPTLLRLTFLLAFLLANLAPAIHSFAQNELELASGSVSTTATTGPRTTAPETATLLQNTTGTTFVPYSPPINVSVTLSNQSYTAVAGAGGAGVTGNGIMFGANLNTTTKAATSVTTFSRMNSIGAPASNMFTSNPNGTAGTGIDVTANYAFDLFTTVEPLFSATAPLNGRYLYGNVTISFNRPVNNPVIHFVGMGGTTAINNVTQGFATEFELATAGLTISRLSGSTEFAVLTSGTSYTVANTAATITAASGGGASSGSIKVENTNVSSITFRVYIRGDGKGTGWSNTNLYAGDRWLLGVSLRSPSTISGTVFDDANGGTVDGVATNAGGTLYANVWMIHWGLVVWTVG